MICNDYSVIRFQNVEVNDEGEYTCTATNDAGAASASATIKVRSPPVITITPNNYIDVNQGDRVNVECRADGYPEPEVSIKCKFTTYLTILLLRYTSIFNYLKTSWTDELTNPCCFKKCCFLKFLNFLNV